MAKASDFLNMGAGERLPQLVDIATSSISSGQVATPNNEVWLINPASNPNGLELIKLTASEATGSASRYVRMTVAKTLGQPINVFQQNSGGDPIDYTRLWLPAGHGIYVAANLSGGEHGTFTYTGVFR